MPTFINNTPIFRRLFVAFALATIVPAIIILLLGGYYLSTLTARGEAVTTSFQAQSIAYEQQINLQRMNALLQARQAQVFASLSGNIKDPSMSASGQSFSSDIAAGEINFSQTLVTYQANFELATSPNMQGLANILTSEDPNTSLIKDQQDTLDKVSKQQWPAYRQLQDQELDLLKNNTTYSSEFYSKSHTLLSEANSKFLDLENSWQHILNIAEKMGTIATTIDQSQAQPIIVFTLLALVCTIVVVVTIGYIVNITITRPLRQLALLTRRIAKGDTNARAKLVGRDEIYMVADSMNKMLDNIVRLIQETQSQRDLLQAQVEKLVSEVSGVGEGDLRIQAEVTADALGVLADSFNYMVEELSSLIVNVKMVTHEVENSTLQTFDRMTQLVKNADNQIHQISQSVIEIEYIADSSRQVAERAKVLSDVASEARQMAQTGRGVVQQTVEGIGRINENVQVTSNKVQLLGERSREINNIVEVISNIAYQTNRLALDAAIQAALAGENGKGFGAVAADIRRLAERTKDQVSMIARIVRSVREDIDAAASSMQETEQETSAGSELAQQAGRTLETIYRVVEQQAQEIEYINTLAVQQVQSSGEVVQIMHGVSDASHHSNVSTRETSHNMERLARLAEQLLASVEAFKLREDTNAYIPSSSVTIVPETPDESMSVSGVFRTVTGAAQPVGVRNYDALPPASVPTPPSLRAFPVPPYQPNGNSNRKR